MPAPESTYDPTTSLLQLLDLNDGGATTDEDIFTGFTPQEPRGRVFGGQVLAQSLVAAMRTVETDRPVHSMHAYFLRPGDVSKSITFGVQRLRDGRSFSARRTHAYQDGVPILSMIATFQKPDPGVDHFMPMPENVPDPESLPSAAELLNGIDNPEALAWMGNRPFDIRHLESPLFVPPVEDRRPYNAVWMKTLAPLPDDPNLHRAALAYGSDYTLLEPIFRKHGLGPMTPGVKVASLDHAMWWHRPVRVDDWLLYVQESPSASGSRGLGLGRFYNRAGDLVASVAQEGMVRLPRED